MKKTSKRRNYLGQLWWYHSLSWWWHRQCNERRRTCWTTEGNHRARTSWCIRYYPITVWWWPAFCGLWNRMWAAWNTDEKGPTEDTPCVHQTLQYLCTSSYFIHLIHTRPRHCGLNRLLLHGSQKVYGLLKLLALSTSTDCLTRQGQDWTLGRPGTCCLSTFMMRRHSVAKFWSSVFRVFFRHLWTLCPLLTEIGNKLSWDTRTAWESYGLWRATSLAILRIAVLCSLWGMAAGKMSDSDSAQSEVLQNPCNFELPWLRTGAPNESCAYILCSIRPEIQAFRVPEKLPLGVSAPWDHGLWSSLVINHPILYDRPGWLTLTTITKIGDFWDPMGHLMSLRFWLTAICWRVFSVMTLSYPPFFGQVSALKVMTSQEIPCRWDSLTSARAC